MAQLNRKYYEKLMYFFPTFIKTRLWISRFQFKFRHIGGSFGQWRSKRSFSFKLRTSWM